MAVSLVQRHHLLEVGCNFRVGPRHGSVVEARPEGFLVVWEEWSDPETGVITERAHRLLTHEHVEADNRHGQLVILSRPRAMETDPDDILRHLRTHEETSRMLVRKACALAAEELIAEDRMGHRRRDFEEHAELIVARARTAHARLVAAMGRSTRGRRKRAVYGSNANRPPFLFELEVKNDNPASKGASIYNWLRKLRTKGEDSLFDAYRRCGGKAGHTAELADFVAGVVDDLADMERPSISSLHDSVLAAIQAENARRFSADFPLPSLSNRVSKAFVKRQADRLGCAAYAIRSTGFDRAYRDMHALGVGITTYRALERVEIDEYTIDLTLLLRLTGIFKLLAPHEIVALGFDGAARRVVISAAIDVHTRCLLALQIVPEGTPDTLRQTLEMIYTDKTPLSDAVGCRFDWVQHGAPEEAVLDRGSPYVSDEAYHILASLGITNIGSPAGKPWLKPFIERTFRTLHSTFLQRFSGRNFENPVKRGDNDPAARATLTIEEFLGWLVRWTVDGYHNRRHEGLGMTPLQAWEEATSHMPVRQITNREMRLAFGTRVHRTLGRHGLKVMHVTYQSDALTQRWFAHGGERLEICHWGGDIGAIEVRAGNGEWVTVPATDERWIGKDESDLHVWLEQRQTKDPEAEAARLALIHDIDAHTKALKLAKGLFARPRTANGVELTEAHFARHIDTSERRYTAEPYRDLLADEVLDESQPAAEPETMATLEAAEGPDDEDLLE
ncbi:DDE-type integrase/transposase/recombinase [Pseudooceanicola algae]|uniref:Uncharacterized protein n=1 Tax=Pseudooceanicola algae TaxID=1537215 RepID=A0A418SBB9_9RHOB|nr:DDE-type integrase/transposase/recombinase [Pseudooceanicola algae]QPM91418.1 hypothetical protein PSAL_026710 [Pseudooceanicola algae]